MTAIHVARAKPEKELKQKVCLFAFFAKTIARNVPRNFTMKKKLMVK